MNRPPIPNEAPPLEPAAVKANRPLKLVLVKGPAGSIDQIAGKGVGAIDFNQLETRVVNLVVGERLHPKSAGDGEHSAAGR